MFLRSSSLKARLVNQTFDKLSQNAAGGGDSLFAPLYFCLFGKNCDVPSTGGLCCSECGRLRTIESCGSTIWRLPLRLSKFCNCRSGRGQVENGHDQKAPCLPNVHFGQSVGLLISISIIPYLGTL